jgi:hypothetical protein
MKEKYVVYKTHYLAYEEIRQLGELPRELVADNLSLNAALKLVEEKGFGYSAHPQEQHAHRRK